MKRYTFMFSLVVVGFWMATTSVRLAAMTISKNGVAQADIVVAQNASTPERHAAAELADFLGQVTGGKFQIVAQPNAHGANICVGREAAKAVDPKFSTDGLGTDGLIIRTSRKNLILAGGEPRGTLYAVYTFLEDYVGCHWWTPDASTIPRRPTLRVRRIDMSYTPALEYRETDAFSAQNGDFAVRNKYNGSFHQLNAEQGGKYAFVPGAAHTFYTLISPDKYFAEHPEWFSLVGGKRTATPSDHASLCLTSEAMRQQLVQNLKQALRDAPAEAENCGLSAVRFYLVGGHRFVGDPGPGRGWNTSGSIKVTASSEHRSRKALRTIDGSGLDAATGRLHGTDPETMFMTGTKRASAATPRHPGAVSGEHWIAFEFDKAYPLGEMWIWNQNETRWHIQGMRQITIRSSLTGGSNPDEWTTIFSGELPEASGLPDQPHQIAIDIKGTVAKYVVITAHKNWAGAFDGFFAEVSQPDDSGPPDRCECPACTAVEKEEGSPAGVLIRFLNAVVADLKPEFPNVPVSTLAYHYTQHPPKLTKPRDEEIIRLCSIKCSFSKPMSDERNAAFRDDVIGWSKICRRLYIWDYVANFTYSLNPHPNLRVLGPNIRFLVAHGVKGIFAEALSNSPHTEMAELRSWVLAKLMWNPNLDDKVLVREFVRGYYGPAAKDVLAYINLMHDAVEKSGDFLGLSSPPDAKFLSLENLCHGWQHLAAAEKAAGTDQVLRTRVRIAQLPVMYVFLMRWEELRKQAQAAQVPWPMPDTIQELHQQIQQIARQGHINLAGLPTPIPF